MEIGPEERKAKGEENGDRREKGRGRLRRGENL